jgi:hypothetical protein
VTHALPFTQSSLRRAIEAARKAGLHVTGIRPDGTVIVSESREVIVNALSSEQTDPISKWQDIET